VAPEALKTAKFKAAECWGAHASDMIGEITLPIEMGADAVDIGKTIQPTLGENIVMAAEVEYGSCTDL